MKRKKNERLKINPNALSLLRVAILLRNPYATVADLYELTCGRRTIQQEVRHE
jgi:hypothetical protein